MSELHDVIVTVDTREQNNKRIRAVEDWANTYGAVIDHHKLDLCDYHIIGEFRGHEINLGIEAKSLSDFCSCGYEELKEKLFDSFELYDEVALFIETGNYAFRVGGFADTTIINPAVRDGSADTGALAMLEGCCSTLPSYGIHVRQLRSEAQFPYTIENLMTYITHDHTIIKQAPYLKRYKQTLLSFATPAQTKKILAAYPNLATLCSEPLDALHDVLGRKTGQKVHVFIHEDRRANSSHEDTSTHHNITTILPVSSDQQAPSQLPAESREVSSCFPPAPPDEDWSWLLDSKCEYKEVTRVRNQPKRLTLRESLKRFLEDGTPHTLAEIVDAHDGWNPGTVYDNIHGAVKLGSLKKIQANGEIMYQRA